MTEYYRATKNIDEWLQRAGLTLDALQKLPPGEMASVGRQWQSYQQDVDRWAANSGVTENFLPNYEIVSAHAVPNVEGARRTFTRGGNG